jgi:hypothetical protein
MLEVLLISLFFGVKHPRDEKDLSIPGSHGAILGVLFLRFDARR